MIADDYAAIARGLKQAEPETPCPTQIKLFLDVFASMMGGHPKPDSAVGQVYRWLAAIAERR